jgi:hypothetical protein
MCPEKRGKLTTAATTAVDTCCECQPAPAQTLQPARLALKITAPYPPRRLPGGHDRSAPNGLLSASQPVNANEPPADQNGCVRRIVVITDQAV